MQYIGISSKYALRPLGVCLILLSGLHSVWAQDNAPRLIFSSPTGYSIEDEGTFPHYTNLKTSSFPIDNYNQEVVKIERMKDETLLTVISRVHYDWEWFHFSRQDMIVDSKTGDQYKLRAVKGGIPLDTCFFIRGQRDQVVEFSLVFPPLPRSVKKINYIQLPYETRKNSVPGAFIYNLDVKALMAKEKEYKPRPVGRIIK